MKRETHSRIRSDTSSMTTKHGVLTNEGIIHTWQETGYATLEMDAIPPTLEGLIHLALQGKFTHLWIHPSTHLAFKSEQAAGLCNPQAWDIGNISIQKQGAWKGYVTAVVGRLAGTRTPNTRLIFIEQGNWPLDKALPEDLLRVCDAVENRLGVSMAGSPTSVGLRYLEKMNTRYYAHYFEKSNEVDWEALKTSHIPQFAWFPPAGMDEQYKPFLHCFDRNSSQPFAAASENMGVGTPFVQEGGEFDRKTAKPGLWDVEITSSELVASDFLPLFPKGHYWLPTPVLRVAQIAEYGITVHQAMLWPEGKPIFERWAKDLWAFRECYPDGSMERKAIKSIMNNPIGSTRIGEDMDKTLRPDWYATIIGSERAVVWYKAWKLAKDSNVYPCGAYADALYYLSSSDDPHKAVPGMLNAEHSLGGYKCAWTLPIDSRARDVLAAKLGANMRIAALKKLVRGEYD
jgi:hypothetical protein